MHKHMKTINAALLLTVLSPHLLWAQDAQTPEAEGTSNAFGFTNFWELIEQAGWFRWFILGVLVIGLFLIAKQSFELWSESRRSARMQKLDLSQLTVEHLEDLVRKESDHMLARLVSTLLNVYKSSGVAIMLHEEASKFIAMEQERFGTFKQRVDFLSDSAGAFGLLGTVWGIFMVFSQRDLDPQNILGGMGLALITTLLGLVVSIILNLFSTEVSNKFTRRLEKVAAKADQARFRMMQEAEISSRSIADEWSNRQRPASNGAAAPAYKSTNGASESASKSTSSSAKRKRGTEKTKKVSVKERMPAKLARLGNNQSAPAGFMLSKEIGVQIFDDENEAISGVRVEFLVKKGNGHFQGEARSEVRHTDDQGIATIPLVLGSEPGFNQVMAQVDGVNQALEFQAMGVEA